MASRVAAWSRSFVGGFGGFSHHTTRSCAKYNATIEDAVYLRAWLVHRRDHRRGVGRVMHEGMQDRDDFGGRGRIKAWKKKKRNGLCVTHRTAG
jgi:hypothetical protein